MTLPVFSALSALSGDATKGYIILKASGNLTLDSGVYDIFVVGGGGAGGKYAGSGGGGGYATTKKAVNVSAGTYAVTIGSGSTSNGAQGGTSKIIIGSTTVSAAGGYGGTSYGKGGDGGSGGGGAGADDTDDNLDGVGGAGGSYGNNGAYATFGGVKARRGGTGQGAGTTRAFSESSNTPYSGGGGGESGSSAGYAGGAGGAGGGGAGSSGYRDVGTSGTTNTGGGGGGSGEGCSSTTAGGSGLVIVRWGY